MLIERIAKFGLIGVLNTTIDFVIFNILSSKKVGWGKIPANIVSTTCAMIFSYIFNKSYVFDAAGGNVALQVAMFFAITMFGLYVIQNVVIWFLTEVWTLIPDIAFRIVRLIHLDKIFKKDFVYKNSAKVIATLFSLTWNFLMYSNFVFKA